MDRIAFFGTSTVAIPTLNVLANSSRNVVAVFCNPDRPKGRGRHLEAPPVKHTAQKLGLPCYQPERWSDPNMRKLWESLDIDLAIVVAYGYLLPSWVLDKCKLGIWNLHFSILPRWRGASPVNYAILMGDDATGVSLMRLTKNLDEGPILAQCSRPITVNDNASGLLTSLSLDAANLLLDNITILSAGTGILAHQDPTKATFAPKLNKAMAKLKISQPAIKLHRQIRAMQPWPGAEFMMHDSLIKIHSVGSTIRTDPNQPGTLSWNQQSVWLTAGDNNALELTELQRSGKTIRPAPQTLQFWGNTGRTSID